MTILFMMNILTIIADLICVFIPYDVMFCLAPRPYVFDEAGLKMWLEFEEEQRKDWKEHKLKNFLSLAFSHTLLFLFLGICRLLYGFIR